MTEREAVTIGINAYPDGAALSGCVNDAVDWGDALRRRGYNVLTMLDGVATKTNILDTVAQLVASTGYGDRLVIQFSGHGSRVVDRSGDEADGYDEVLVTMNDAGDGFDFIRDDDIARIIGDRKRGARLTFICDSCYSGTVTRFADFDLDAAPDEVDHRTKIRFMPPAKLLGTKATKGTPEPELGDVAAGRATKVGQTTAAVLMSGCAEDEYSYDAWFDHISVGRPNGAFTRVAVDALNAPPVLGGGTVVALPVVEDLTYNRWYAAIRASLPSEAYPQTPMLLGTSHQRHYTAVD
jgi:hypothetical protein